MDKINLKNKIELFNKLKSKGIFWSYAKSIRYADSGDAFLCEYTLKYGDFEDLKALFLLYEETWVKKVWEEKLVEDKRFQKLNLFLARIFLGMNVESNNFERSKSARFEKFRLLAS
jgi:hypothetical protein